MWGSRGGGSPYTLSCTALSGQKTWIASAAELEAQGARFFTTLHQDEVSAIITRRGTGFPLRRDAEGGLFLDGSVEAAGVLAVPPTPTGRPLSLLIDTGAQTSVAGERKWREILADVSGAGRNVRGVGDTFVQSLGTGTLKISFRTAGHGVWSAGFAQPFFGPSFAIKLFETEHTAKPLAPSLVQSVQVRTVRSQTFDLDIDTLPEGASCGIAAVEPGELVRFAHRPKSGAHRGGGGGGSLDASGGGAPSAAVTGAASSGRAGGGGGRRASSGARGEGRPCQGTMLASAAVVAKRVGITDPRTLRRLHKMVVGVAELNVPPKASFYDDAWRRAAMRRRRVPHQRSAASLAHDALIPKGKRWRVDITCRMPLSIDGKRYGIVFIEDKTLYVLIYYVVDKSSASFLSAVQELLVWVKSHLPAGVLPLELLADSDSAWTVTGRGDSMLPKELAEHFASADGDAVSFHRSAGNDHAHARAESCMGRISFLTFYNELGGRLAPPTWRT